MRVRTMNDSLSKSGQAEAPSSTTLEERRKSARHTFSAAVEVFEPLSHLRIAGRSSDLSLGGCYLDMISPLPVGTQVTVRLQKGNTTLEAPATVIYSKVGMGMGLAFGEMTQDARGVLEALTALSTEEVSAKVESAAMNTPAAKSPTLDRAVVHQLIRLLIRKRVLTEDEGTGLLEGVFR
jgi:hypothetical protein